MFDKNKLSFWTRIKLCLTVLFTGNYNPEKYLTRDRAKQLKICQQRQKEMDACIRPRTETYEHRTSHRQNRRFYTDYDERNEFRKSSKGAGLYIL